MFNRKPDKEIVFQTCLKALEAGEDIETILQRHLPYQPEMARELRLELEAAVWLKKRKPVVSTRPGYISASRRSLTGRIRAEGRPRPLPAAAWLGRLVRWPWTLRQAAQALVLMIFLFSFVSVSRSALSATPNALPGDVFYPLKVMKERVILALTLDPVDRTRLQVGYSQERAYEIEDLILEGSYDQLSQAVLNYVFQLEQTRQAITTLAASHPEQAVEMNSQFHTALFNQTVALPVLINMLPIEARSSVAPVMLVAH